MLDCGLARLPVFSVKVDICCTSRCFEAPLQALAFYHPCAVIVQHDALSVMRVGGNNGGPASTQLAKPFCREPISKSLVVRIAVVT